MKQKTKNKAPVTKEEITDILKSYPSKRDVDATFKKSEEQIEKIFDQRLAERLIKSQESFRKELAYRFEMQDEKWDRRLNKFANLILTSIDPPLKELKTRQQEWEIVTGQIADVKNDIKNHEKRITKLEHP